MYNLKRENLPKSGNWSKGYTSDFKANYEANKASNYLGIEFITIENSGTKCTLSLKFSKDTKRDDFLGKIHEEAGLIGTFRRASLLENYFGMVQTSDLKTIGLLIKMIHQSLPFEEQDKKDLINFCKLDENALEENHSYSTCTVS